MRKLTAILIAIALCIVLVPLLVDAINIGANSQFYSLEILGESYHSVIASASWKADRAVERCEELRDIAKTDATKVSQYMWLADRAITLITQAQSEAGTDEIPYVQAKQGECEGILTNIKTLVAPLLQTEFEEILSKVRFMVGR